MTIARSLLLDNAKVAATIALRGAELKSLRFSDREFIWQGDPAWWSYSAPMLFPIVGRLPNGQINHAGKALHLPPHGFARELVFSVEDAGPTHAELSLRASPATLEMYPFAFELRVRFVLHKASLMQRVRITNLGSAPMPASFGFHPAFCWPTRQSGREAHSVRFTQTESADVYRVDNNGRLVPRANLLVIPDKTLALDDELFEEGALVLNPVASSGLEYWGPHGRLMALRWSGCKQLGIWTLPGAPFVCFEPWHGHPSPDSFSGELGAKPGGFQLQPGQSKTFELSVSF